MERRQKCTLILVPRMCGGRTGAGKFKIQRPFAIIPPCVWGQLCRRQQSEGQIYRGKYLSSPENGFWVGRKGKKIKAEQRFSAVCSDVAASCRYLVHPSLLSPWPRLLFLALTRGSTTGSVMVFLQHQVQITSEKIRLQDCFSFQQLLWLFNFSISHLFGKRTWWCVSNLLKTGRFPAAGFPWGNYLRSRELMMFWCYQKGGGET